MANTPLGFPYPALTDAPNGPAQIQALAQALDSFLGPQTDWLDCILQNTWSGSPQVRIYRGFVIFRGGPIKATYTGPLVVAATLPAGIPVPPVTVAVSSVSGDPSVERYAEIAAGDNHIQVATSAAASATFYLNGLFYPAV